MASPAPLSNRDVARRLRTLADLLEASGADRYRVRAYRRAAGEVERFERPVAGLAAAGPEAIALVPGVGPKVAGVVAELLATGEIAMARELARRGPASWAEIARVPGLGPERARRVAERLGVTSLLDLAEAAREGRLREVPGIGPATEARILRGLAEPSLGRARRAAVAGAVEDLLQHLRAATAVERVDAAGSYRRLRDTVGGLEVVCASAEPAAAFERLRSAPEVAEVSPRGERLAEARLASGLAARLVVAAPASFGAALYRWTGSTAHLAELDRLLAARGMRLEESGVHRGAERIGGREEADVLDALGLPWIPPELREGRGELEAAREGRLPRLLETADLRGDLQVHTTWSDGRDTLRAMAEAAEARGLEYVAFTDHTKSLRVANGLDEERFRAQWREIEEVQRGLRSLSILRGAEVDLLEDGSLDLDDDVLAELDVVLVSIHSAFDLAESEQTARVVRALRHPSVDVFAHPRGRRIGHRTGARFDLGEVARVAREEGVMLEIDATPERLDLDDVEARQAVEAGVALVVSTDAHSAAEFDVAELGVHQARRAWVEPHHVANARPLEGFLPLLHRSRRR